MYTYILEDVEEDLENVKEKWLEVAKDSEWTTEELREELEARGVFVKKDTTIEEMVLKAYEELKNFVEESYYGDRDMGNVYYSDKVRDLFELFGENDISDLSLGQRISPRITLWRTGYRLAYEQLKAKGEEIC